MLTHVIERLRPQVSDLVLNANGDGSRQPSTCRWSWTASAARRGGRRAKGCLVMRRPVRSRNLRLDFGRRLQARAVSKDRDRRTRLVADLEFHATWLESAPFTR